jgi:hypothetical protein
LFKKKRREVVVSLAALYKKLTRSLKRPALINRESKKYIQKRQVSIFFHFNLKKRKLRRRERRIFAKVFDLIFFFA